MSSLVPQYMVAQQAPELIDKLLPPLLIIGGVWLVFGGGFGLLNSATRNLDRIISAPFDITDGIFSGLNKLF